MIEAIHFVDHFGVVDADLVEVVDQFALELILVPVLEVFVRVQFLVLAADRGQLVVGQRDRDGRTALGRIEQVPVEQVCIRFDQSVGIQQFRVQFDEHRSVRLGSRNGRKVAHSMVRAQFILFGNSFGFRYLRRLRANRRNQVQFYHSEGIPL